jgi:hypothetical protein
MSISVLPKVAWTTRASQADAHRVSELIVGLAGFFAAGSVDEISDRFMSSIGEAAVEKRFASLSPFRRYSSSIARSGSLAMA